jgi:hypothetical protein
MIFSEAAHPKSIGPFTRLKCAVGAGLKPAPAKQKHDRHEEQLK